MNVETAREYSLSKKAATEDMPFGDDFMTCLLYTSPSPRDYAATRMPSSA